MTNRQPTYATSSNKFGTTTSYKLPPTATSNRTATTSWRCPDLTSHTDYYAFGQEMPGRKWVASDYRYSHNGHEKENEIYQGAQSAELWMFDSRIGRRWERDPIVKPWESPYACFRNNPIYYNDIDGGDAGVTISGNSIKITSKIYIYGSGASAAQAKKMQSAIMNDWNNGGKGWKYTDQSTGQTYNVTFDVSVELYDKENPTNTPFIIPDAWNPSSVNNYVEIGATSSEVKRSFVKGGDEGQWRGYGSDPSSHEFGHTVGLTDRYTDDKGVNPGWEGNVMGEAAGYGVVQQKNIDAIVKPVIEQYKGSEQYNFNFNSTNFFWRWNSKIDEASPGWEHGKGASHETPKGTDGCQGDPKSQGGAVSSP